MSYDWEIAGIPQSAAVCKTIGQKVNLFSKFRVMDVLFFSLSPPLAPPPPPSLTKYSSVLIRFTSTCAFLRAGTMCFEWILQL